MLKAKPLVILLRPLILPSIAHFMAVLRSFWRRLILWPTYLCTDRHHWASSTSGCKLQRPITNWQIDFVSVLYYISVSLSTNFTLGNIFPVTTALTLVWLPNPGNPSWFRHHTCPGVLWCRSACPLAKTPVLIVVVALLLVKSLTDGLELVDALVLLPSWRGFLLLILLMVYHFYGNWMLGTTHVWSTFVLARSQNRRLNIYSQASRECLLLIWTDNLK